MNSAQKMALARTAIDGLRAKTAQEKAGVLDAILASLREIAADDSADEDDKRAAVRMLKSIGASVTDDGGDRPSDEPKDATTRAIDRAFGTVRAQGVRVQGRDLVLGHMTPEQAAKRARELGGGR